MARVLKNGELVKSYEIVRLLNRGAMALSYEASHPKFGRVFLKQYKSPSPTVAWYEAYKSQQTEIKKRITTPEVKGFCGGLVEFFETTVGGRCYFQVFEFVEAASSLQKVIERIREGRESFPFEKRLILARRFVAGLNNLHAAKVVHCDLKPQNILLLKDESIAAEFVLKLIDMDFSALAEKKSAWEGYAPYVGSPNYFSPEHLRGTRPGIASDVFTCGLMLYELLGQGHPYASDDPELYSRSALGSSAPRIEFAGGLPPPLDAGKAAEMIRRCLAPDPSARPTAGDVLATLRPGAVPSPGPKPDPRPPAPPPTPTPASVGLSLLDGAGHELRVSVRTEVGLELLKRFGPDALFNAPHQFTVEPSSTGGWFVAPGTGTKNETLLNGKCLRVRTALKEGDVLSIGREATGVSKLPLKVVQR